MISLDKDALIISVFFLSSHYVFYVVVFILGFIKSQKYLIRELWKRSHVHRSRNFHTAVFNGENRSRCSFIRTKVKFCFKMY